MMFEQAGAEKAIWAMRTSRNEPGHRDYVWQELSAGRLRQGWGYGTSQNLAAIIKRRKNGVAWETLENDEKLVWPHWKLAGIPLWNTAPVRTGDLILVPNLPENSFFVVCQVTGDYYFSIDPEIGDLGHVRPVRLLTPGGVAFDNDLVSGPLRRSLRCRSRFWALTEHTASIDMVLATCAQEGGAALSREGADHFIRAHRAIKQDVADSLNALSGKLAASLGNSLQSAEWEHVFVPTMLPVMRNIQIIHTGGPSERGADIEIQIPNPFCPSRPWLIVLQIKDYDGEIDVGTVAQLEEAICARRSGTSLSQPGTDDGYDSASLLAVVLVSTRAKPSRALIVAMDELSRKYGVSVSCVAGDQVARMLARGFLNMAD